MTPIGYRSAEAESSCRLRQGNAGREDGGITAGIDAKQPGVWEEAGLLAE